MISLTIFCLRAKLIASSANPCDYSHVDADFEVWMGQLEIEGTEQDRLRSAFNFAREKHNGMYRKSGEPYLLHPFRVARGISRAAVDIAMLQAAILHDVVEDCGIDIAEIETRFGSDVAYLVNGVSKIGIEAGKHDRGRQTLLKVLDFAAKDIRVAIIKIYDRIDNMNTLNAFDGRPDKQERIARETLEVYIPVARRLGLNEAATELDNKVLFYLDRNAFDWASTVILEQVTRIQSRLREISEMVSDQVRELLGDEAMFVRPDDMHDLVPHPLRAIAQAVAAMPLAEREPLDWMTVDITVNGTNQIYQVMGIIHRLLALQIGTDGIRDEVHSVGRQKYHILETTVRDREMGRIRFRITTHIDYERYANGHLALTAIPEWYKPDPVLQEQLGLLIEENRATTEVELRTSIGELGPTDPLKLLTPTGQIISLRQGSTPLDFACFIHGNIGLRASGALVNGKEIPLTEPFKREHYGSTVKIITDPPGAPSALRLRAVRTSRARQVLRHALRERSLGQTIDDGRTNLNQAFGIFALTANQVQSATITKGLERTMRAKPFHLTVERRPPGVHSAFAHLCHAIGMGEIDPGEFVRQFVEEMSETANERRASRTKKGRRNPFFVLRGTLRDGKRLGEILMELERLGLHPTDTRTRGNRITVKLENEGIVQRWQLNNLSPLFLNDVSVRSTPLPRQT